MNWLARAWERLVERARPTPVAVLDSRFGTPPTPKTKYTGADSQTQFQIRHHLRYGPLTRRELDDLLDVQTACIHLPLMVERGELTVDKSRRPYRYELAVQAREKVQ